MQNTQLDTSVRTQDDFFGYVNNAWLKANPIPPSESMWGTFYVLRDQAWRATHEIVEDLTKQDDSSLSHEERLLKTFFASGLHYESQREQHIATVTRELEAVNALQTKADLATFLGAAHRQELSVFWTPYVSLDDKDSKMQVLRIFQDGLNLPNRDYYLDDTEEMRNIRSAYETHYKTITTLLPELAHSDWKHIIEIETDLARAAWTDVELRDIEKNYNHFTIAELNSHFPSFDWSAYFTGLGWKQPSDHVIIDQPSFIEATLRLIDAYSLEEIKSYLSWHTLGRFLSWIDETVTQANFDFYGKVLGGAKELQPLWKRVVLRADQLIIGETLGREYAKRHFPESSKESVLKIVEDIRRAYHARIDRLDWMTAPTKARAHTKLDNIKVFIGYPTVWRDVSTLSFSADNFLENGLAARGLASDLELAKIGNPPAEEEWEMHAHTVNAYHHPNRLEIVFPAAILQSPFYDPHASYATNLGGIGAVIGHEFTHGFDDQGSQFDEAGNTKQWQSDEERKKFMKLADVIVRQADTYETVKGTFLQGKLVLGEAIADLGGLELAIEALRADVNKEQLPAALEELFVNFARAECGQATQERLVELAKTDPHPPSPFRVNCVVTHADSFYDTYHLEQSDKLYLPSDKRARIW